MIPLLLLPLKYANSTVLINYFTDITHSDHHFNAMIVGSCYQYCWSCPLDVVVRWLFYCQVWASFLCVKVRIVRMYIQLTHSGFSFKRSSL